MASTRAIVTGAADGIGQATALVMASGGAHLVLVDQDESTLLATCRDVRDAGARVEAVVVDLAGPGAAQDVVVLAEERGVASASPKNVARMEVWTPC